LLLSSSTKHSTSPDIQSMSTFKRFYFSFNKSPIQERPYCSLTIKTTVVFRHAFTSTSVSHFLFNVVHQKWRKNLIHFSHHYKLRRQILLYLVIAVPRRVSFIYHKNIIIETRYNIEGAPVYWKHCIFFPHWTLFNGHLILVFSAGYPYTLPSDTGANRPAIRRFGKKGKKTLYIFIWTQSYII